MLAVFVRRPEHESLDPGDDAAAVLPTDLAVEIAKGGTLVARRREGPYLPIGEAMLRDARLVDELARALEVPSLARYTQWRRWLLLGLLPIAVLTELERELVGQNVAGVGGRLAGDAFLLAFAAWGLLRPVPRRATATALVLLGVACRYAHMLARSCGEHPGMVPLALLSLGAALGTWRLAPSPARLRDEIAARLDVPNGAPRARANPRVALAAVGVALAVPVCLSVARAFGLSLTIQGAVLIALALLAPPLFRRRFGWPERPSSVASGAPLRALGVASAVASGLGLTLALTHLVHYGVGALAHAPACFEAEGALRSLGRLWIEGESGEVSRAAEGAKAKWWYVAMTVLAVPLAEERIYRDLVQRVLGRELGRRRGTLAAAGLFGFAHIGVYRVAMLHAVLLGVGFGAAFEEAGLLAAVLTHAIWNLYWVG